MRGKVLQYALEAVCGLLAAALLLFVHAAAYKELFFAYKGR